MNLIGTAIGAMVGLIVFHNPIGLLLGGLVGWFFDSARKRVQAPTLDTGLVRALFGFAGALSKSDGRVSESEIAATEALIARLRLDGDGRRLAIERFSAGKQPGFDVDGAIAGIRQWCHGRRDLAFIVLDLLLDLVHAEGALAQPKLDLVRRLCAALGVGEHELAALSAMRGYAYAHTGRYGSTRPGGGHGGGSQRPPQRPSEVDPYTVLGIARGASDRDIKQAYRRLMSQHHPDKLGDVPPEIKQRAEERAREINAAYERIKAERGLK